MFSLLKKQQNQNSGYGLLLEVPGKKLITQLEIIVVVVFFFGRNQFEEEPLEKLRGRIKKETISPH